MGALRQADSIWWRSGTYLGRPVREILRQRDMAALFCFLKTRGWSRAAIAAATGLSESRVRAISQARQQITSYEVLERIADGLVIDRGLLGLAYTDGGIPAAPQPDGRSQEDSASYAGTAIVAAQEGANLQAPPHQSPAEVVSEADNGIEAPREIGRRRRDAGMSNLDEAKLGYLEHATRRAIEINESQPPAVLAPQVRGLRRHVGELLHGRQHPPQRSRLYTVAAYLSGLLGALALDLGQQRSAAEYGLEAYELANALDLPDLRAWARATQSLIAYYAGEYHDALAFAQDGQRWAAGGPQSVRLAINGEARALAKLGDVYGVDEAVDRAFTLLARSPATHCVSPSLAIEAYCPARTAANAATAYLATGAPDRVQEYATHALTEFDRAGLHGPQALSRLDLATAALLGNNPEPEHGCALVKQAMTVAADERFESVNRRAQDFLAVARPWRAEQAVREVADLVRSHAVRPVLKA
jgi:transcriptional regulator with XRE-family HTH domain